MSSEDVWAVRALEPWALHATPALQFPADTHQIREGTELEGGKKKSVLPVCRVAAFRGASGEKDMSGMKTTETLHSTR